MCIRTHPVGMLTDAHNWLQYFLLASIVLNKDKNTHTPTGVWVFLMDRWDSNNQMQ